MGIPGAVAPARSTNQTVRPRDVVLETDGKPINGNGIVYQVRRLAPTFT